MLHILIEQQILTNSLKLCLKYFHIIQVIIELIPQRYQVQLFEMLAQQYNNRHQLYPMKQQELIRIHFPQKVSQNIQGEYNIANPDSFIISQYGFLRSIWGNHFKNSLSQYDSCEDRIDRLNKIVAMMKGRIANRTHKQFQISENIRSCIFSQQLFKQKSQKSIGNQERNSTFQGQFQRILTQYIYQNPLFRKIKQQLQRSQMQRQNLLHQIQKIQKQKCNIQKNLSKMESQKSKLCKKIKELTKKIIELSKKNVELGDQLFLSDNYGYAMKVYKESQGQQEYDLAQSIVLEHHQSQNNSSENQGVKCNETRRSLILQFDKINSVADTKTSEVVQRQYIYQNDRRPSQSKSAKIINKQKIKQIRTNINLSSCNSFDKQLNTQVDSSYICYTIQRNKKSKQQTSLNDLSLIQYQKQKILDQRSNILPICLNGNRQDISSSEIQCAGQILKTECKMQQLDESISQYQAKSENKMFSSGSKVSISRSSGQNMNIRFSRKASGSKIRFGMTPKDRNVQQLTLRQSQKEIEGSILKSLTNPQVYKENQFYTKFTKLKAMKTRIQ